MIHVEIKSKYQELPNLIQMSGLVNWDLLHIWATTYVVCFMVRSDRNLFTK